MSDQTFPGLSNRIFMEQPGYGGGGQPRDILGTNSCQLETIFRVGMC